MSERKKTSWLIPMCMAAVGFVLIAAPGGADYIADGVTVTPVDRPMSEIPQQPHRTSPTDKDGPMTVNCDDYLNYTGFEPPEVLQQCGGWAFGESTSARLDRAPADTAYALDIGYISDNFVRFTLNDFPGQTYIGDQPDAFFAMDFDPSATALWAINDTLQSLGTIDLATGAYTAVNACSCPDNVDGNFSGMTIAEDGTMYASSATNLYVLDPANPTDCSPVLIGAFGNPGLVMIDIAINKNGEMYGHDIVDEAIFSIDPATGMATMVGLTNYAANYAQGMDFDFSDGTLYIWLYVGGGANVYGIVDLMTGAVTPLATDNPTGEFLGAIQVPSFLTLQVNGPVIDFTEGLPQTWQASPAGPEDFGPVFWSTTDDPAATDHDYAIDAGTAPGAIADCDFLNYPNTVPYEAELWTNSFSLLGTGQPKLNLLWLHRPFNNSYFQIDISTDGGTTWGNLFYDEAGNYTDGGAAASLDLTPWIGEPDVIARFVYAGDAWDWYAQIDEVSITATYPGLELRKTVGIVPEECAATDAVAVDAGDEVVYCYTATNTGNVPLTLQSLTDSHEGLILDGFAYELLPGYSVQAVLASVPILETTTNSGTWTGFNPGPVDAASATDTATVVVFDNDICDSAVPLVCPGGGLTSSAFGTTIPATFTDKGTCETVSHSAPDAWYHVEGNGGSITATLCSPLTDYDTKMTVWSGDCSSLECVTADDDNWDCGYSGLTSEVTWFSEVGVDYFIMVHGYSSGTGNFELIMECEIPVELQSFSIE